MLHTASRAGRIGRTALALLSFVLLLGAAGAASARGESLRVAVEGEYPPFNKVDAKGRFTGFDVEVAQAVCAAMAATCKLVQQPWDRMISGLVAGHYDMVVSSMSITSARRQQIDFTDPYYQTPAKFVAKKGASLDAGLQGLKGKRIGVQKATNHDQYLTTVMKEVEVVRYPTVNEATADLAKGKVDLVFGDAMGLDKGFLKTAKGKGFAFVGPDVRDSRFFGQGMAIAVRKGNAELRERLNAALAAIRASGHYDAIERKYFVFDMLP